MDRHINLNPDSSKLKEPERKLSKPEIILKLLNLLVCILYAGMEHNTGIDHPFNYALQTACRMTLYAILGQFIGNFFFLVGDIAVVGGLGFVVGKMLWLQWA
jgi:hypothetical protein